MTDSTAAPKETKLEHPCFPQPRDLTTRVWRHLDLAKLVWLLENKKLHLSRLDLLNDPHEGSTPRLLAQLRDQQYRTLGAEQLVADTSRINRQSRKSLYVNCWHLGNSESEAMWRLYCPNGNGVAIQTTYQRLVDSIGADPFCYIGSVNYIDYDSQGFPLGNMFYPVMHKRISFMHEQEIRLVKTLPEFWGLPERESPPGLTLEWPAETAVEAIYVDPYAPEFYHDVVRSIVRRLAPSLEGNVHWSRMRSAPSY